MRLVHVQGMDLSDSLPLRRWHAVCEVLLTVSYGLQISASGVAAAMHRQDVLANNLANMDTVGFKPDLPRVRTRPSVRTEDGVGHLPSNKLLERLGGGVSVTNTRINLGQGSLRLTGNPLDVAIQGEGFFTLENPHIPSSQTATLTRDGRFTMNASGNLVSVTNGWKVLDESGRPITLLRGSRAEISGDGAIRQNGKVVARVGVAQVDTPELLEKQGNSSLSAPATGVRQIPIEQRSLRQAAVEQSGVDETRTLIDMTSASRNIDAHVATMQAHDKMMERAINSLGRTS